jgi:hypothetical protein
MSDVMTRFQRKIKVIPCGCHIWTGATVRGYASFNDGTRTVRGHRWIYEQRHGKLPDGMSACHTCDTPSCVNVDHLFPGTQADNLADASRKGRIIGSRKGIVITHCKRGHLLSGDNVYVSPKTGSRGCQICRTLARKAFLKRSTGT